MEATVDVVRTDGTERQAKMEETPKGAVAKVDRGRQGCRAIGVPIYGLAYVLFTRSTIRRRSCSSSKSP